MVCNLKRNLKEGEIADCEQTGAGANPAGIRPEARKGAQKEGARDGAGEEEKVGGAVFPGRDEQRQVSSGAAGA